MALYIVELVMTGLFILHALYTGRDRIWIWILLILPYVGEIAYIAIELAPELLGTKQGREAQKRLGKAIDPAKALRRTQAALETNDSVYNRRAHAGSLMEAGQAADAYTLLQSCLTGMYAEDVSLLRETAEAAFAAGRPADTLALIDRARELDPDYYSARDHRLYALSLMTIGRLPEALDSFAALADRWPGEEARTRHGQLLMDMGRREEARAVWERQLDRIRHAPKRYLVEEARWIEQSQAGLAALQGPPSAAQGAPQRD